MSHSYEDLRLCNCAECGRELASASQNWLLAILNPDPMPARLAGRLNGRPYCGRCLQPVKRRGNTGGSRPPRQRSRGEEGGDEPYLDKATRDAEETAS